MEKGETQNLGVQNTRVGGENPDTIDPYLKGLNELRKTVKTHINAIKGIMVEKVDMDINLRDTIDDLLNKIQSLLYCENGEYCQFSDALIWILDFSDDIKRIAGYENNTDIYIEASKIWYAVHKFYFR